MLSLSTSRTISNLTKNSQYNFKVRAVNDIGWTGISREQQSLP